MRSNQDHPIRSSSKKEEDPIARDKKPEEVDDRGTQKEREATHSDVSSVLDDPGDSRLLSLDESYLFLKERGMRIDFYEICKRNALTMIRLGIYGEDKRDCEIYARKLNEIQIHERDLQYLVRQFKKQPDFGYLGSQFYDPSDLGSLIVVGVDSLTPQQMLDKLSSTIPISGRFSEFQRVDPKTGAPLQDQGPSGKAGILFTPKELNLRPEDTSTANDQLAKMASGQQYVGPVWWIILFCQGVDEALRRLYHDKVDFDDFDAIKPYEYQEMARRAVRCSQIIITPNDRWTPPFVNFYSETVDSCLPDTKTRTLFADWRSKDGKKAPSLSFYTPYNTTESGRVTGRKITVEDKDADTEYYRLGGRVAFGTFPY